MAKCVLALINELNEMRIFVPSPVLLHVLCSLAADSAAGDGQE